MGDLGSLLRSRGPSLGCTPTDLCTGSPSSCLHPQRQRHPGLAGHTRTLPQTQVPCPPLLPTSAVTISVPAAWAGAAGWHLLAERLGPQGLVHRHLPGLHAQCAGAALAAHREEGEAWGEMPAAVPTVPTVSTAGWPQVQLQCVADVRLPIALLLCAGTEEGQERKSVLEPQVASGGPGVLPPRTP